MCRPERKERSKMTDYERTVSVAAGPDAAFESLTDPANLPRYVATMLSAEAAQDDTLHVAADVQGRHEEGYARFTTDEARRRMDWAGPGDSTYRGWLQVDPTDSGSSVWIHLEGTREEDDAEVARVLDETVANIKTLLATD
jgi:hypothetical protein